MKTYLDDILSQPFELRRALKFYAESAVRQELEKIGKITFSELVWSGMGSSHFCALPASVYLSAHGIRSQVISAGELLHYEAERIQRDTLLCLISQSGESAEIVRLLDLLPPEVPVLAITNTPESRLGRRGNWTLPLHVSNEKSVTTRTYLASVILALFTAFSIIGKPFEEVRHEFDEVCLKMEAYLAGFREELGKLDAFSHEIHSLSIMGRGYALATVRAGALFFREVSRFAATDFDAAEFRHGPMELVDDGFFSIVLAPSGKTQRLSLGLAESVAEKGGRVVLITDSCADKTLRKNIPNLLRIDLPVVAEYLAPFLQILPLQLFADRLAQRKGIPAGEFRWGSKVTATE